MSHAIPTALVPTVDPEDLRACWESSRDFAVLHPGAGWAGRGRTPEYSLIYRATMLMALFMDPSNPLASWRRGDDLDDVVFRVAAEFPMHPLPARGVHHGWPFDKERFLARLKQ